MSTSHSPLLEVAKDAIRVLAAHNLGDEIDLQYCHEVIANAERPDTSGGLTRRDYFAAGASLEFADAMLSAGEADHA